MLFDRLNLTYFVASFALGILVVYLTTPSPVVVVKFPSPINAGRVVYRNSHDGCFKYKAEKHACPVDSSKVRTQPIVEEDFRSTT